MQELEKVQAALALLMKELFLLPMRLEKQEDVVMFSNIIIDRLELEFNELKKLMDEVE